MKTDIQANGRPAEHAEPLFWYRPRSDGGFEGPIHNDSIGDVRKRSGVWLPLVLAEAPCLSCGGSGWLGGPTFQDPGEGGEPCKDCAPAAPVSAELTLLYEQALSEFIDKIVPGLDTGDLLADARQASAALDINAPVAAQAQQPVSGAAGLAAWAQPAEDDERLTAASDYAYASVMHAKGRISANEVKDRWDAFVRTLVVQNIADRFSWHYRRIKAASVAACSADEIQAFKDWLERTPVLSLQAAWEERAERALQEPTLQAEVLGMVWMLEANEWADHCGESELGHRLESAITTLQNRIAELTKSSNQQDAVLLDALTEIVAAITANDDEGLIEHSEAVIKARAAIDAARKEQT